jgi:hypothetical protein
MISFIVVISLPIISSILVEIITSDYKLLNNNDCPPHTWSNDIITNHLICSDCNKYAHSLI